MSVLRRRALTLTTAAVIALALVGCSSDSDEPKAQSSVESEESTQDTEPSEDAETEDSEETDDSEPSEDLAFEPVPQDSLETTVASAMDGETGTTFPVECDGDIESVVGATQRCWRIITGYADQGIPDNSRLGLDVTVDYLEEQGPHLDIQADDAVSPPAG